MAGQEAVRDASYHEYIWKNFVGRNVVHLSNQLVDRGMSMCHLYLTMEGFRRILEDGNILNTLMPSELEAELKAATPICYMRNGKQYVLQNIPPKLLEKVYKYQLLQKVSGERENERERGPFFFIPTVV